MTTTVVNPPEQGQLVSVRSRQWIVNDVLLDKGLDQSLIPCWVVVALN
jgi:hypothetical protein